MVEKIEPDKLCFVVGPMSDDELNARATANFTSATPVFSFINRSDPKSAPTPIRKVEVTITSPLFTRDGFPFLIGENENVTTVIAQKLPRVS